MTIVSPTKTLEQEHRVILKVLKAIGLLVGRLEAGQAVEVSQLRGIVEFMRIYADKCHHGKEEDQLFLALARKGVPMQGCPVGTLTDEHARGRALVTALASAVEGYATGNYLARDLVLRNLRGLASLYPDHIWKEDFVLFPMARKVLNADELSTLSGEFEHVDYRVGVEVLRRLKQFADRVLQYAQPVEQAAQLQEAVAELA